MDGFRRGDESIHIIYIDGYKKPILGIGNGNTIKKVASFNDDECAEEFHNLLCRWFKLEADDETRRFTN